MFLDLFCLFIIKQNKHVKEVFLPVDKGGNVLRMKKIYDTGCDSSNTLKKQQLIPMLSMSPLDLAQCKTTHPLVQSDLLIETKLTEYKRAFHSQLKLYLNEQIRPLGHIFC